MYKTAAEKKALKYLNLETVVPVGLGTTNSIEITKTNFKGREPRVIAVLCKSDPDIKLTLFHNETKDEPLQKAGLDTLCQEYPVRIDSPAGKYIVTLDNSSNAAKTVNLLFMCAY